MTLKSKVLNTYDNWKLVCAYTESSSFWWTQENYVNCVFIPNKDYPDLSKVQLSMTGQNSFTGENYDNLVRWVERLYVDMLFITLLVLFLTIWFYKILKKIFF